MSKQEAFKNSTLALLLGACVVAQSACAQPGGGERGERRGPPPEAYEACADLAAEDSCEMTGRRGETMQGSCIIPKGEDNALACAPEGGPGGESESGHPAR